MLNSECGWVSRNQSGPVVLQSALSSELWPKFGFKLTYFWDMFQRAIQSMEPWQKSINCKIMHQDPVQPLDSSPRLQHSPQWAMSNTIRPRQYLGQWLGKYIQIIVQQLEWCLQLLSDLGAKMTGREEIDQGCTFLFQNLKFLKLI